MKMANWKVYLAIMGLALGLIAGVCYKAYREDREERARQAHIRRMMEFADWCAENGLQVVRQINK